MFRGKRGLKLPLWVLTELILLGVIIVFFMTYTYDIKQDTYFQKTFVVKDLSFLLGKIQSSPGNVKFHYLQEKFKTTDYDFTFDENHVGIFEPGNHNYKIIYPLFYNRNLENNFLGFEQPTELFIHKTPLRIEFTNQERINHDEIIDLCREIINAEPSPTGSSLSATNEQSIVLIANDESASVIVGAVAEKLTAEKFKAKKIITTKNNIGFDIGQIGINDMVVELSVEKGVYIEKDELLVQYGLSSGKKKGERLACMFHNTLIENLNFISKGVEQSQDKLLIRNPNGPAVHLSLTFSDESDVFTETARVSDLIVEAVGAYI